MKSTSINKALLIFLIAVGISVLFSLDRSWSFYGNIERMMGYLMYLNFAIWFLFLIVFFKQKDFEQLFKFVAITGAVMAVLGIAQYFCVHLGGGYKLCFSQEPQPLSLIGNPSFLGAYLLLCAGSTLLLAKRWWYWTIPMWVCLVLCRTRGLWLGVAIAVIVGLIIYWLDKRNAKKKK